MSRSIVVFMQYTKIIIINTPINLRVFPWIYLLSYFIDFRQLHFGLHVKVNAGGCTHQYNLEVDSVFNVFTLRINFMHLRACILGDYPVPRHMWICIVAGGTSSLPKYLLACACAHLPTRRHLVCISTSNLVYLAITITTLTTYRRCRI